MWHQKWRCFMQKSLTHFDKDNFYFMVSMKSSQIQIETFKWHEGPDIYVYLLYLRHYKDLQTPSQYNLNCTVNPNHNLSLFRLNNKLLCIETSCYSLTSSLTFCTMFGWAYWSSCCWYNNICCLGNVFQVSVQSVSQCSLNQYYDSSDYTLNKKTHMRNCSFSAVLLHQHQLHFPGFDSLSFFFI